MLKLVTGATNELLHKKTALVENPIAHDIQSLIPEMIATMHAEDGTGLAAPQIGRSIRLAVLEHEGILYTLINPEITSFSQEKIVFEEGCLSLPGQFFPIIRSETITIKYLNEKGLLKKLRAQDFLAVIIQHEIDHLDGILICDRFQKQQRKLSKKENQRLL